MILFQKKKGLLLKKEIKSLDTIIFNQSSNQSFFETSPGTPVALMQTTIKCESTMADFRDQLPEKWRNYDFTNAIGLLLLMKQIQEDPPKDDPNILKIDEDGTRLY